MSADGWVTLLRLRLNYGRWGGGQRDNWASALSCHCRATALTPPLHKLCPYIQPCLLPAELNCASIKITLPLLPGFLCNFLLKVKGNNKAGAALQPPPDIAAPSTTAQSPASALPSKATLSGIFPADFSSQLEGFPPSGGICRQGHTFWSLLWRPARDFQVYTKNSH